MWSFESFTERLGLRCLVWVGLMIPGSMIAFCKSFSLLYKQHKIKDCLEVTLGPIDLFTYILLECEFNKKQTNIILNLITWLKTVLVLVYIYNTNFPSIWLCQIT